MLLALPISSMAQGIVFAPAFWLGGIALAGRGPRALRWVLVGLGAAPAVLLWVTSSDRERELVPAPTFLLGFWLLAAGMAYGGSQVFRRWPRRSPVASRSMESSSAA